MRLLAIAAVLLLSAAAAAEVPVPPAAWLACQRDSDCVLVPSTCYCCAEVAVAVAHKGSYQQAKEKHCLASSTEPVCDCAPVAAQAVCARGRCKAQTPVR